MNQAERIYRIHHLLSGRRQPSFTDLLSDLGVSKATLKRDIAYMRDFMRAPIAFDRAAGGYRYDPDAPEFELPGLWFNDSELLALLASEQLLEAVRPGLLAPHLGPLKARIRQLLEYSGHSAETVASRIAIHTAVTRRVDNDNFGRIAGAVLDGHVLEINYEGRTRGETTQRRIHPYRLIHYRENWYAVAHCEQAGDLRTFAVDRVRVAEPLEQPNKPPNDEQLRRHLGATFGIFAGEARAWAVLRFSPHAARWVADEVWHPDQIGQWQGDGYELQVPYSDPRELIMDLLKYGPDVEVIAPPDLRDAVASRIREAAERYGERRR